jgi:hypothetical protein
MATISQTRGFITLSDLQTSREYLACSSKMRHWLTILIENGFDYPAATAAAFDCKNPRVFSYAVRNWPKVRAALNLYLGRSEQEAFLDDLQKTIRRAPAGSDRQVRAQALYARLKWNVSSPASEEPETPANSKLKTPEAAPDSRIPAGATPLVDRSGVVRGYRSSDGQYVQLANFEAAR